MSNTLLFGMVKDILGNPKKSNITKEQYSFDCPICSAEKGMYDGDGKGNLEINMFEGVYHCWSCGESHNTKGGLNKFFKTFATKVQIKKLYSLGIDVYDLKKAKKGEKIVEEATLPETFIEFKDSNPKTLQHKEAWNYLVKQRKLTEDIIYKYRMGYTTGGQHANRIILPSYDINNKLNYWVGRTYINQKPKYLNPDLEKEEIIFNEYNLNYDGTIYVVEGPFDHIVVHNSVPMLGKKMFGKLMNKLFYKTTSNIVILLDSDAWLDAKNLYGKLNVGRLYGRVKVVRLIKDYDIAKVHEDFGREGVIDVMDSSYELKESEL